MAERLLGQHPARRAAYVMIVLSLMVVALAAWNVTLSRRVGEQEAIRRAEARGAVERQKLGCRIFTAIVDVAIDIPLTNLHDILDGNTLTPEERQQRLAAQRRYDAARQLLTPALKACST